MLLRRTLVMVPLAALSACASWRGPGDEEEGYDEVIERLAITPTGDKLVVVGRRYHYTFANPPTSLTRTIQSRLRPLLAADFQAFKVVDDVHVSGTWVLSLRVEPMSDDNVALAKALGFVLNGHERYVLRGEISGRVHTNERSSFRVTGSGPTTRTDSMSRAGWGLPARCRGAPSALPRTGC